MSALMAVILIASPVAAPAAEVMTNATFTKVTTGNIVLDHGNTYSGAWADFDNDGFIDLVVDEFGLVLAYIDGRMITLPEPIERGADDGFIGAVHRIAAWRLEQITRDMFEGELAVRDIGV